MWGRIISSLRQPASVTVLAVFLCATAVFVAARGPAGLWTIDDAAITAVDARNTAAGLGVVISPGAMPTEGYSNPLLFLISTVLALGGLLHPLWTHLVIEALSFGTLAVLVFSLLLQVAGGDRARAAAATALFVAYEILTPANLIWYGSGLENLQLTLGIVALLWRFERWWTTGPSPVADGLLALAVALVRPESFLYPLAILAVVAVVRLARGARTLPHDFDRRLLMTVGVCLAGGLLFLGLRRMYFGAFLPNTYYAKLDSGIAAASTLKHLQTYVERQMFSHGAALLFVGGTLAAGLMSQSRRLWLAVLACLGAAVALPASSGADWMGLHRFATAFFALAHLGFVLMLLTPKPTGPRSIDLGLRVALGLLPLILLHGSWEEYRQFTARRHATVDVAVDDSGLERLEVQDRLGLRNPVVALPDAGGPNWLGRMQFVDTLALADYHVARTQRSSPGSNFHYQARERRVDLVEWHGVGALDPGRFGGELVRALGRPDPHRRPFGFWVRRELVEGGELDAGARLLGEVDGMGVYLSPRTVAVAVPRAVVRIELLFRTPAGAFPPDTRLRVSGGGDQEELPLLTAHPASLPVPVVPPGRVCRQGALLHMPDQPGPVPVTIELLRPGQPAVRFDGVRVEVLPPEAIDQARIDGLLSSAADVMESGHRLAALTAQSAARLARAGRSDLVARFRMSRDARHFDLGGLFDRLHADANAAPVSGLADRLAAARARLVARADAQVVARHDAKGKAGSAALALQDVGFLVDDLRRVELGDVIHAPGTAALLSAARKRWLSAEPSAENYPAFLGLTLIDQGQVRAHKKLFAARPLALGRR
jgi:hypothetical protein